MVIRGDCTLPYLSVYKELGTQRVLKSICEEKQRRRAAVSVRGLPTQGDRSRMSGSQSQSRHSPPRPGAGNHLHSRPDDSLEGQKV